MENIIELSTNPANLKYKEGHGITQDDMEKVNYTIYLIERIRDNNMPIFGDQIICTTPDKIKNPLYPQGHLDSPITKEFASICVQPSSAPFVFHNGLEITRYSCSGGYWTRERELGMYTYIGQTKKLFCQWGHCGMAHSGAIYFHAIVNEWLLIRENLH